MNKNVIVFRPNFFQKFANSAATFAAIPFFAFFLCFCFVDLSNSRQLEFAGWIMDTLIIAASIMIPTWSIIWHLLDLKSRTKSKVFPNEKYWYIGKTISKWLLVGILMVYAIAKFTGLQLTADPLWYGTELGEMNGFMLAWAFFGYSKTYSIFIALGQIAGALSLLFERTVRLGLIILIPILVNILVIDFTFDGLESPRIIIVVLLYITLFIFFEEFKSFKAFFWTHSHIEAKAIEPNYVIGGARKVILKTFAFILLMFYGFIPNYLQKIKKIESPLQGVWYSEAVMNYNDSLQKFQQNKNELKLFVNGQNAVIKLLGKETAYNIETDLPVIGDIKLVPQSDILKSEPIKGKYSILNENHLQITGMYGNDSVIWTFMRKNY